MHQDEAILIFNKIFKKVDSQWKEFIAELKQAAEADDQSQIWTKDFFAILLKYGVILKPQEKN